MCPSACISPDAMSPDASGSGIPRRPAADPPRRRRPSRCALLQGYAECASVKACCMRTCRHSATAPRGTPSTVTAKPPSCTSAACAALAACMPLVWPAKIVLTNLLVRLQRCTAPACHFM